MRRALTLFFFVSTAVVAAPPPQRGGFLLAGEPIRFDALLRPRFTARQLSSSSDAVRAGLELWAATAHGRSIIGRLNQTEYEIRIVEDSDELGAGRAPEPALAVLVAFDDRSTRKTYELVLNPGFVLPEGTTPLPGQPATAAQMMAAAWAGEMLHIDFYSRGISLPHHHRTDFQQQWDTAARQLGFPGLRHGGSDEYRQPYVHLRSLIPDP